MTYIRSVLAILGISTLANVGKPQTTKPYATVTIASEPVTALFDSGSAVNLMAKSLYNRVKHAADSKVSPPGAVQLASASGDSIKIHATFTSRIDVAGKRRAATFFVVDDNCGFQALIGTDFMAANQVTINVADRKI